MKCPIFFLFIMILTMFFTTAFAQEELTMLKADGQTIINAKGEPVQLRGVNLGGWLVQEGWMNLPTASARRNHSKCWMNVLAVTSGSISSMYMRRITSLRMTLITSKPWA